MRAAALVFALSAAVVWTIGGILLKKGTDVVSTSTILVTQYVVGMVAITGYLLATGGAAGAIEAVERQWLRLLLLVACQIGGYICFVAAVAHSGKDSLPTAVVLAIAATYPALVALLSGPFLGQELAWHHALGVALIVAGVVVTLVG